MFRYQLVVLWGLCVAGHAAASSWAEKLFDDAIQDFGVVPRGQILTHSFRIVNRTGKRVHVADVRVSCGCTAARALQQDLAPDTESAILAQMDTRRFSGAKTVTIYVRFDYPRRDEARLSLIANSRQDSATSSESHSFGPLTGEIEPALKVSPHVVEFGEVAIGAVAERKVVVRSPKGFRITGMGPRDGTLRWHDNQPGPRLVHVVTIRYKPAQPGVLDETLSIATDTNEKAKLVLRASAEAR
jgi:hypothetical protein